MFSEYDDILSVEEAKELLKIGHNQIYKLLNTGKLKGYKCGRVWKIPKEAITRFIKESAGL